MEFDTSIRRQTLHSFDVASPLPREAFFQAVWDCCAAQGRQVGDGGAGTFWLDYSTALQVRHLCVEITDDEPGTYHVVLSSGKRPSLLWDVLMMAAALLAFWSLGKVMRPDPPAAYAAALGFAAAGALFLGIRSGKEFGKEEVGTLRKALESL